MVAARRSKNRLERVPRTIAGYRHRSFARWGSSLRPSQPGRPQRAWPRCSNVARRRARCTRRGGGRTPAYRVPVLRGDRGAPPSSIRQSQVPSLLEPSDHPTGERRRCGLRRDQTARGSSPDLSWATVGLRWTRDPVPREGCPPSLRSVRSTPAHRAWATASSHQAHRVCSGVHRVLRQRPDQGRRSSSSDIRSLAGDARVLRTDYDERHRPQEPARVRSAPVRAAR